MEQLGILAGSAAMMAAVIAAAVAFARFNPFYRRELASLPGRELALDGLRGMAALLVAVHHAAMCRKWTLNGDWADAGARLPQIFGPAGVILFFMLTGYLFWGKARAVNGRMNPLKLWRGRLYRIAPLYFFSLVLVLLVITLETGGNWLALKHWLPLARLVTLGAIGWKPFAGVNPLDYNAGVTWTLAFEWRFYLILPFIAWLITDRKLLGLPVTIYVFIAAGIVLDLSVTSALYFIFGMLAAELLRLPSLREVLQRRMSAAAALVLCFASGWLARNSLPVTGPNDTLAVACLPIFLVAAAGNSFFGFLVQPALRCLGAISFSLYLLHGIVFKFVGWELKQANLNHLSLTNYWLIYIAVAVFTTCLCAATYRWIEFPFLSVSHKTRSSDPRWHDPKKNN